MKLNVVKLFCLALYGFTAASESSHQKLSFFQFRLAEKNWLGVGSAGWLTSDVKL
jgi:hypothetical protein